SGPECPQRARDVDARRADDAAAHPAGFSGPTMPGGCSREGPAGAGVQDDCAGPVRRRRGCIHDACGEVDPAERRLVPFGSQRSSANAGGDAVMSRMMTLFKWIFTDRFPVSSSPRSGCAASGGQGPAMFLLFAFIGALWLSPERADGRIVDFPPADSE